MHGTPVERTRDEVVFRGHVRSGRRWMGGLLPVVLVALLLAVRPSGTALGAGAKDADPATLMSLAADSMDLRTSAGGAGYTFTVTQQTWLDALPGGKLVDVPAPSGRGSAGTTDHYLLATFLEQGAAVPGGFWLEIRDGPKAGDPVDFAAAPMELAALVVKGTTWRDDGAGWYETKDPPGIGLDPRTAGLLSSMLRSAADPRPFDAALQPRPGAAASLTARITAADLPGLIAVDGEAFTEITRPLELSFDDQGRLVAIHAVARHTGVTDYDMTIDTVITFDYPLLAPDLPKPEPVFDPASFDKQAKG